MKKYLLAIFITGSVAVSLSLASAHEPDEANPNGFERSPDSRYNDPRYEDARYDRQDRFERGGRLQYEVDHLNGMLEHVQRELRRYGADRHIWAEYQHIRTEAWRLNNQLRRGEQYYNRWRVRAQVQHMHDELHHIEEELHVRANEWYRWR